MPRDIHTRIALLAQRQGGHVSRSQLLRLGLGPGAITRRVKSGVLIAVFNGVYAVGHLPTSPLDRAKGALLACGPTAALSHGSAASLWGIERQWQLPLEVIVTDDHRLSGVRVHRSSRLLAADIRVHLGVRATSPALTVLHVAQRVRSPRRIARVVNDLRLERRLTIDDLTGVTERFPRHPGAGLLRPIIAASQPEPTRSGLEDAFLEFARAYELPHHEINVTIAGYRVDVFFPAERLIVELDGFEVHRTRQAFERDRAQDAEILEREGIPTVRITHRRLVGAAADEAARIHAILASRRYEAA